MVSFIFPATCYNCILTNCSCCIQCAIDTTYWTGVNHFVIWVSILFYFALTFALYSDLVGTSYIGTATNLMSTATFWFTLLLTVVILLVPVVAERFYYIDTRPTLTDKVRLKQKISKSKSRSGEMILRRASTMRRSTRSLNRSGYAFAHQEGFGNLIMSGVYQHDPSKAGKPHAAMAAPPHVPHVRQTNGNINKHNSNNNSSSSRGSNSKSNKPLSTPNQILESTEL